MTSQDPFRRAIDELEIRNNIARMAIATDIGDLDEYASLFSDDAHLEMRADPGKPSMLPLTKGRAAILVGAKKRRDEGVSGPASHMVHAIQSSAITISGDTAKAITYVVIYKNAHTKPEGTSIKVYKDEFVRASDGWKLAARLIDSL